MFWIFHSIPKTECNQMVNFNPRFSSGRYVTTLTIFALYVWYRCMWHKFLRLHIDTFAISLFVVLVQCYGIPNRNMCVSILFWLTKSWSFVKAIFSENDFILIAFDLNWCFKPFPQKSDSNLKMWCNRFNVGWM